MKARKTFILDTSVLLYDKESIHSFPDSDVVIPLVVLDEVDRFKEKMGVVGEYARYVNRYLDDLREKGNLHEGIAIENGQTIRVEVNYANTVPDGLNGDYTDNRIIGLTAGLSKDIDQPVTLITKDINFRVKCDALGIKSEDYYKDRIVGSRSQIYSGQHEINISDNDIDKFYSSGKIKVPEDIEYSFSENEFIIGKSSGGQSFLSKFCNGFLVPVKSSIWQGIDINPRNKEQKFALDLLTDRDVSMITLTGIAGSGKTYLALVAAISGLNEGLYERIVITRSLQTVGKDIGFLPGTVKDKMDPWVSPISDNFRAAFKDMTYFEIMREKGDIEVTPLSFIRGRTFNNTFLIVDEAQNSTIHELKTIITRVGEGSKVVLLGDIEQIDTPYIDSLSNGLTVVVQKFKNFKISGHVTLLKGERSKLATLASKVI